MSDLYLTSRQRERLRQQLHATPDSRVYRRTLAVLQVADGRPVTEVADLLGVGRRSVYHWLDAYRLDRDPADLHDRPGRGHPTAWTDELRALLRRALEQPPDAWGYRATDWTVALLQDFLVEQGGERLADATIRRQLHALGYAWKRSRYVLPGDPEAEKKTAHPPELAGLAAGRRVPGRGRDRPAALPAAAGRLG